MIILLLLLGAFFITFLAYPLLYCLQKAFFYAGGFSLEFFHILFTNPFQREYLLNSLGLAFVTTLLVTVLSLPLAFLLTRWTFRGKSIFENLILLPLILPPFVGAIGMRQILARFGSLNLLLMKFGLMSEQNPVDWLGGGFWGVVLLETLHLYPILFLNLSAALANIDPALEEAGANLGAGRGKLFRSITMPLLLPGYFAGASIVFIWAFTDLGTPLVFDYRRVVPVQIFDSLTDIHENPIGYTLVVTTLLITLLLFYASKKIFTRGSFQMMPRGPQSTEKNYLKGRGAVIAYSFLTGLFLLSFLPHLSIICLSVSKGWFMSIMPEKFTFSYYQQVFSYPLTSLSIRNSLLFSMPAAGLDLLLGVAIAYLLSRKVFRGKEILDLASMLPLALPGIVLAFGYVVCFSGGPLDVRNNPVALIIISYSVRRLPYMVRSAYAGFQQLSPALEEASMNLGASPLRTAWKITIPLLKGNLLAGGILCFSFAVLEVSDSLILAMKERFYPITKAIYMLLGRISDGPYLASAMGVMGMGLLFLSLILASRLLGRRVGDLFRA